MAAGSTRDTRSPSRTTQPLSLPPSATVLPRDARSSLGANLMYVSIAPTVQALLGIDLGTTGVKAALFATDDGRVLFSAFVDYPLMHPHPGWAEQDPHDWWQATITAIRGCLAGGVRHGIASTDIRGVGLSGQMHGVVL